MQKKDTVDKEEGVTSDKPKVKRGGVEQKRR